MRRWFENISLASKLGVGFGLTLLLTIGVAWSAASGVLGLRSNIHDLADRGLAREVLLSDFLYNTSQARTMQYRAAGSSDAGAVALTKMADDAADLADAALKKYSETVTDPQDKELTADVDASWKRYRAVWSELEPKLLKADAVQGFALMETNTVKIYREEFSPALKKLNDWNLKYGKKTATQADSASGALLTSIVVMTFFAVAIGAIFGRITTRMISRPLGAVSERMLSLKNFCVKDLTEGLQAMAAGDLTFTAQVSSKPIPNPSKDEIGRMADTLNGLMESIQTSIASYNSAKDSLSSTIRSVSGNAKDVAKTSQTLAAFAEHTGSAATEIATGSEKLARTAADSAATMEEFSAQVSTIMYSTEAQEASVSGASAELENAKEGIESVAAAAQEMTASAHEGNEAVQLAGASMVRVKERVGFSALKVKDLDEKGRQIGHIVQSITTIAEQTNLLALNAAIEAARAGEHGRGFAVVAEEVRKLAEQASRATQEISTLITGVTATVQDTVAAIEAVTAEVGEGAERSNAAGQALTEILEASRQVAERAESVARKTQRAANRMSEVASMSHQNLESTKEMAESVDRVATSISNVAAISQESAAGAEELMAGISEVSSAAQSLSTMSAELDHIVQQFKASEKSPKLRIAA